MRAFVGREKEVSDLRQCIREGQVRWVSGLSGVGKTTLVERAVDNLNPLRVASLWMGSFREALHFFCEALRAHPEDTRKEAVLPWLQETLKKPGPFDVLYDARWTA